MDGIIPEARKVRVLVHTQGKWSAGMSAGISKEWRAPPRAVLASTKDASHSTSRAGLPEADLQFARSEESRFDLSVHCCCSSDVGLGTPNRQSPGG